MTDTYKTLPIGTVFTYNGNKYKVCKYDYTTISFCCYLCAFCEINCDINKFVRGECYSERRLDKSNVYFELLKDNKDKAIYYESLTCATEKFSLEDKNAFKTYINAIEEKFGSKLNFKTLKIEKTQLGFKDGDILSNSVIPNRPNGVFIFKNYNENKDLNCYVGIDDWDFVYNQHIPWCSRNEIVRYATEEEKKRLFKALATIGKHWNAEKKVVEDIETKYQFKPFEKVLVRDSCDDEWRASFFSHFKESDGRYVSTGLTWKYCIPYEGNESLLGTNKDVEE